MQEFEQYVYSFYGKKGIYIIDRPFTMAEIRAAIKERLKPVNLAKLPFGGDSFDRELVRDIVLKTRNPEAAVEYNV